MINIAIVDDDSLIRESLKIILSMDKDIKVVKTGENGDDAIKIANEDNIDVLLLDMRMPKVNGIDALKVIGNKVKVLVLTTFEEDYYLTESIKLGARGYLLKNATPEVIIKSIKDCSLGNIVFTESTHNILKEIVSKKSIKNNEDIKNIEITDREREIIEKIAEGLSNKEIGEKLFISEGTVKNYISTILNKTNLEHRTQIAIKFLKGEL